MPFLSVDRDRQTKLKQRQEIHLLTTCRHCYPAGKRTSQKRAPQSDNVGRPSPEPMVDKRGLPDTGPGNYSDDIYILVGPRIIQESDILLSTKNIASCNRQSGY